MKRTCQILSLLLAILSVSCTSSSIEDFVVGDNFMKDNTGIVMIDTLSLKSSMVHYDSISSNSSGRILVGSNYNSYSGYKNSHSFLQMRFDDVVSYDDFVFDSLNLVLYYDTYYFGDTTVSQTITVHKIEDDLKLYSNGYLYSTSQFKYNSEPFGSITLKPKPKSHEKVSIRLSDQLGLRLAQMIMDRNDTLSYNSLFLKVFKGMVIKMNPNVKGAVIGFRATDSGTADDSESTTEEETKPEFRLYYHLSPNPDNKRDLYYKFSLYDDGIYFNQISGDFSNSLLTGIAENKNELSLKLTDNKLFIQSGIQVFSKFQFPHVRKLPLMFNSKSAFVGATMKLYPVKGTYNKISDLPDSLYVYGGDKKNSITGQLNVQGSTTEYAYARLRTENDVEKTVYYGLDISSFISSAMNDQSESLQSLIMGYGSTAMKRSASYLVLGGENSGKYAPTIQVYYYHN